MQAHIDGEEFSAHILTEEAEYNVEVICSKMLNTRKHLILISQCAFLLLSSISPCGGLQSHPQMAVCWCTVQKTLKTSVDCPHPKCVDM